MRAPTRSYTHTHAHVHTHVVAVARSKKAVLLNQQNGFLKMCRRRRTLPPSGPGSTIRAARLNDRVRDGNGCGPRAIDAGKKKDSGFEGCEKPQRCVSAKWWTLIAWTGQATRAISTARLRR